MKASLSLTQPMRVQDLASAAKADRNRAVDFYRAVAMLTVAVGHWCAMAFTGESNGSIVGKNALELAPQMSWITWLLQVMPLFFVVGGFSSAVSLNSHLLAGRPGSSWVADRLRRMCAPTLVLATTWLVILAVSALTPLRSLIFGAAAAAAIPLWFLSNYTIDTAIAPLVRPWFKAHPGRVTAGAALCFALFEILHNQGVAVVGHLNWVLGWLLFQLLGFAWKDGLLGKVHHIAVLAVVMWSVAYALVKLGPWPQAMVHIPGMTHSPPRGNRTSINVQALSRAETGHDVLECGRQRACASGDDEPERADGLVAEMRARLSVEKAIQEYAAAGISEAWIVNIPARTVEVYTQPLNGDYQHTEHVSSGSCYAAGVAVNLSHLFPASATADFPKPVTDLPAPRRPND